jgi:hypothetical protein
MKAKIPPETELNPLKMNNLGRFSVPQPKSAGLLQIKTARRVNTGRGGLLIVGAGGSQILERAATLIYQSLQGQLQFYVGI